MEPPGQFAQYPAPRTREIDFSVIGEAFAIVTKNWVPFVLSGFLMLVTCMVPIGIVFTLMVPTLFSSADPTSPEFNLKMIQFELMLLPTFLVGSALMAPFVLSMAMMTLKIVRGGQVEAKDAFSGWSKALPAIGIMVCMTVAVMIGSYACYLPGFILGGLLMLAPSVLADRSVGPFEALGESWRLMKPCLWMGALLYFVLSLVSGLGVFALCFGIFISMPLMYVVPALVYRDFTIGRGKPSAPVGYPSSAPVEAPRYDPPKEQ